jgi:aryl-alcohol dehydrogenase-like predicted oxidoreductase
MEQRNLGGSGLRVPVLSLGAGTFGGKSEFFKAWGGNDVNASRRMIDIALEHGVNFIDTADIYGEGESEEIVGAVIKGRRNRFLISTKASFRSGTDANDVGSSRFHLIQAVDGSLKRLGTDVIDVYHLHGFDAKTPIEETLGTLNDLVRAGKIRYIAASNFSGWHLMKSLAISDRYGWPRYCAHQVYYSLVGREYEWELMPLADDQRVGAMVWSPLGWGRLTGKIRRGQPLPPVSRLHKTAEYGPQMPDEHLYKVIDALEQVSRECAKSIPQVAINWLLSRPTVSNVIIGARNEQQLQDNLGSAGWNLSRDHIEKLDRASQVIPVYPYWHQITFAERNPFPTRLDYA